MRFGERFAGLHAVRWGSELNSCARIDHLWVDEMALTDPSRNTDQGV
jgi:hypothetical protein